MANQKQYGLILPDKGKEKKASSSKPPPSKNVFGDDSSGDEESNVDWVKQSLKKQSHGSMQQKASMKVMKEALQNDPSVYEYDEVYDDMTKKKEDSIAKKKADKKPKYIEALLKTAKQRDLENELRKEREAQRERENEGELYADKEAFVTSSFKKKMEELRKMQEDQAYTDAIDDVTDVTKQKDMSGFYRQLYRETMKNEDDNDSKNKEEDIKKNDDLKAVELDKDTTDKGIDLDKDEDDKKRERRDEKDRKGSGQERIRSPGDKNENRKRISNRDRDHHREDNKRNTHRDRISSDNREERDTYPRRDRGSDRDRKSDHRDRDYDRERGSERRPAEGSRRDNNKSIHSSTKDEERIRDNEKRQKGSDKASAEIKIIENENWYDFDVQIERDVKKSFYAKRTVGSVFDEALQRYLERKAVSHVVVYK